MTDWIELEHFTVEAVLGVLEREQRVTQPLQISLRLELDLSGAASGDLSRSLNYASVMEQTRTLVQTGQWRLLESIGQAICSLMLAPPAPQEERAQVQAVEVRLRKPTILEGAAVPGVGLRRTMDASSFELGVLGSGVSLEVLCETPLVGAYRVHLAPGTSWDPPAGVSLQLIAGKPLINKRPADPGECVGRGAGVQIENLQQKAVTFLAVSRPPLIQKG